MNNNTFIKQLYFLCYTVIALSVLTLPCFASDTEQEIAHLLEYIEHSGCTFNRNWKDYSAVEARNHMEMKYDYAKDKITTTEQFIKHIATKSSMTGKAYNIQCKDGKYPTAEWLTEELTNYRNHRQAEIEKQENPQ